MTEAQLILTKFCDHTLNIDGRSESWVRTLNLELSAFLRETTVQKVADINRLVIEDYIIAKRKTKKWSNQTVRNRLVALRTFLNWCLDRGLIKENEAKAIKLPTARPKPREALSYEDALKLLEWTKSYRYETSFEGKRAVAIIGMFIYAGLRKQELRNLNRTDVRWDLKRLIVHGKGGKYRMVPINDQLVPLLKPYIDACEQMKYNCPAFFVALRVDQRMGICVVRRLVVKLRETSGIYFYPHMLRHTFATMMLMGGASLTAIQEAMGHGDPETTARYLTITPGYLMSEMNKHALDPIVNPMRRMSV